MEPYPVRIVRAYSQVDSLGLVNYWRNLYTSLIASADLAELQKEFEYAWRVADRDNPLWCVIEQAKAKRKWELQHGTR